jgi:hypothetical protein
MIAMMAMNIIMALAAPNASRFRVNANVYMKVAGRSEEYPGPPLVRTMTRSKLLIAMWAMIITELKNTGLKLGMMIRQ